MGVSKAVALGLNAAVATCDLNAGLLGNAYIEVGPPSSTLVPGL
jgi:hypothetical protein